MKDSQQKLLFRNMSEHVMCCEVFFIAKEILDDKSNTDIDIILYNQWTDYLYSGQDTGHRLAVALLLLSQFDCVQCVDTIFVGNKEFSLNLNFSIIIMRTADVCK